MTDEQLIKRAIRLARKGTGYVNPNPLVGVVLVKDNQIIGEGYHRCYGEAHAEVIALRQAGDRAFGATLYVNLEPCCHYGKTPPCTDAIINAGIKRVVIGMVDPNPVVHQKGIEILRQHQIDVTVGVCEQACLQLNRAFIKYITTGLPYVTLKIAQSVDGRVATRIGDSRWITSLRSRTVAHRLRRENDAVVVGIQTVLKDNPQLTVRHIRGRNPRRMVLDSRLRIPFDGHLLSDEYSYQTIIVTVSEDTKKKEKIQAKGAQVWTIDKDEFGRISLPKLVKKIGESQMSVVLVEGGAQVFTSFLRARLADRIVLMLAPKILGSGIEAIGDLNILRIEQGIQLVNMSVKKLNTDLIITGDVIYQ